MRLDGEQHHPPKRQVEGDRRRIIKGRREELAETAQEGQAPNHDGHRPAGQSHGTCRRLSTKSRPVAEFQQALVIAISRPEQQPVAAEADRPAIIVLGHVMDPKNVHSKRF